MTGKAKYASDEHGNALLDMQDAAAYLLFPIYAGNHLFQ